MNYQNTLIPGFLNSILVVFFCIAVICPTGPIPYMRAQDPEVEAIFCLNPFQVLGSGATDYLANSTLSGSRISSTLGATPWGMQDVSYFREAVKNGAIPQSNTSIPKD